MDRSGPEIVAEVKFRQKLHDMCGDGKKTVLMKKEDYFSLIDELKVVNDAEIKTGRQYYIMKRLVT